MQNAKSNDEEDILNAQRKDFIDQVNQSGVPRHLLQDYGDQPFKSKENENKPKADEAHDNEYYPDFPI